MDSDKLENFERAFRDNAGSNVFTCACGKVYYNEYGGWSWGDDELEELHSDKNAFNVDCAIGMMSLEGRLYADVCDCWHERAERVIGFIDAHARPIAEYLTLEKKRKLLEADVSPTVE